MIAVDGRVPHFIDLCGAPHKSIYVEILPQIFNLGEDAGPQPVIIDVISSIIMDDRKLDV